MQTNLDRRTFLRSTAAVSVASVLAGCGGSGGDGGDGGGDGGDGDSDGSSDGGSGGDGGSGASSEVQEYLSDTSNFDGQVQDMTGQDEVSVTVGAEGNGGAFAFGPAAVSVSTGTTVVWEWNGEGGTHNVVDEDEAFDSGPAVAEEGTTFEQTFEESGTFLYQCTPHATLGMKGAIVVE
ncbi:halocyanin domain-containing protein [Halomicroarcula sp. GCM10025324]|uniref:halocyanin domain-containing protein n=1 Tax=Haloarcula TaxID=2237 RepID=UPI0023E7FE3A|nr:halocyanin domain-containing protein [Halomicroarcula sp. ZS-22-S1]